MAISEITKELKDRKEFLATGFRPQDFIIPGGQAEKIANELEDEDIKPTQLRKVFSEIKLAEKESERGGDISEHMSKIMMQLAYACGRKLISTRVYELFKACIMNKNTIRFTDMRQKQQRNDFKGFVSFVEALVAYIKLKNRK